MVEYMKLGCKKDVIDKRDYLAKEILSTIAVPKFSERDYSDILTPIKNQGSLGSCVGFGVTSVIEFLKQEQVLDPTIDLSEMWVYWKAKEIDAWPNEEGTSIRDALKVLNHKGIPLEKYWPYSDKRTNNNKPLTNPSIWASLSASSRKIKSYHRIETLQELFDWLDIGGLCVAGISCDNNIFNVGSDGMVSTPTSQNDIIGGHCVAIVEYDRANII